VPLCLLARVRVLFVRLFACLPVPVSCLSLLVCAWQDTERLKAAIAAMPIEEAKYHMKRCEDSGLWVPQKD
jgi:hypothetical protein